MHVLFSSSIEQRYIVGSTKLLIHFPSITAPPSSQHSVRTASNHRTASPPHSIHRTSSTHKSPSVASYTRKRYSLFYHPLPDCTLYSHEQNKERENARELWRNHTHRARERMKPEPVWIVHAPLCLWTSHVFAQTTPTAASSLVVPLFALYFIAVMLRIAFTCVYTVHDGVTHTLAPVGSRANSSVL